MGERLVAHGLALPPEHTLVTIAERPELWGPMSDVNVSAWAEFMLNDHVANTNWDHLRDDFAMDQLCLLGPDGTVVAACNCAPLAWDGTDAGLPAGWEDQFLRSVAGHQAGTAPDTLGALQITVRPELQGRGYSGVMVSALRANAQARGFRGVIACVRPTAKEHYPLIPIEAYATWTREDGLPFDPWVRLHVRLGGRIVRPSPASMRIEGSLADWRSWTGADFPGSGEYIVPGAAAPVTIDLEADTGIYLDPNIWIIHTPG